MALHRYLPLVDLGHEVGRFEYDMAPHFRNLDPAYDHFLVSEKFRIED